MNHKIQRIRNLDLLLSTVIAPFSYAAFYTLNEDEVIIYSNSKDFLDKLVNSIDIDGKLTDLGKIVRIDENNVVIIDYTDKELRDALFSFLISEVKSPKSKKDASKEDASEGEVVNVSKPSEPITNDKVILAAAGPIRSDLTAKGIGTIGLGAVVTAILINAVNLYPKLNENEPGAPAEVFMNFSRDLDLFVEVVLAKIYKHSIPPNDPHYAKKKQIEKLIHDKHAISLVIGPPSQDEVVLKQFYSKSDIIRFLESKQFSKMEIANFLTNQDQNEFILDYVQERGFVDLILQNMRNKYKEFYDDILKAERDINPFVIFHSSGAYTAQLVLKYIMKDEALRNTKMIDFNSIRNMIYEQIRVVLSERDNEDKRAHWIDSLNVLLYISDLLGKIAKQNGENILDSFASSLITVIEQIANNYHTNNHELKEQFKNILLKIVECYEEHTKGGESQSEQSQSYEIKNCVAKLWHMVQGSFSRVGFNNGRYSLNLEYIGEIIGKYRTDNKKNTSPNYMEVMEYLIHDEVHFAIKLPVLLYAAFTRLSSKELVQYKGGQRGRPAELEEVLTPYGHLVINKTLTSDITENARVAIEAGHHRPYIDLLILSFLMTNIVKSKSGVKIISDTTVHILQQLANILDKRRATAIGTSVAHRKLATTKGVYQNVMRLYSYWAFKRSLVDVTLTDYQEKAKNALLETYEKFLNKHNYSDSYRTGFILSHATGTGKTHVISHGIAEILKKYPKKRVLILSKDELIRKISSSLVLLNNFTSSVHHIYTINHFNDYCDHLDEATKKYNIVAMSFSVLVRGCGEQGKIMEMKSNDASNKKERENTSASLTNINDEEQNEVVILEEEDTQYDSQSSGEQDSYVLQETRIEKYINYINLVKFLKFIYSFDIIVIDESHLIRRVSVARFNDDSGAYDHGAPKFKGVYLELNGYRVGMQSSTIGMMLFMSKLASGAKIYVSKENDSQYIDTKKFRDPSKYGIIENHKSKFSLEFEVPDKELFYVLSTGTLITTWPHDIWLPLFLCDVPRFVPYRQIQNELSILSPYALAKGHFRAELAGMAILYNKVVSDINKALVTKQVDFDLPAIDIVNKYLSPDFATLLRKFRDGVINKEIELKTIDVFNEEDAVRARVIKPFNRVIHHYSIEQDFAKLLSTIYKIDKQTISGIQLLGDIKNIENYLKNYSKKTTSETGEKTVFDLNNPNGRPFYQAMYDYLKEEGSLIMNLIEVMAKFGDSNSEQEIKFYVNNDIQYKAESNSVPNLSAKSDYLSSINVNQQTIEMIQQRIYEALNNCNKNPDNARKAVLFVRECLHGLSTRLDIKGVKSIQIGKGHLSTKRFMIKQKSFTMEILLQSINEESELFVYDTVYPYLVNYRTLPSKVYKTMLALTRILYFSSQSQMILKVAELVGYLLLSVLELWLKVDANPELGTGKVFIVVEHHSVGRLLYYAFMDFIYGLSIGFPSDAKDVKKFILKIQRRIMELAHAYYLVNDLANKGIKFEDTIKLSQQVVENYYNITSQCSKTLEDSSISDNDKKKTAYDFIARNMVLERIAYLIYMMTNINDNSKEEHIVRTIESIYVRNLVDYYKSQAVIDNAPAYIGYYMGNQTINTSFDSDTPQYSSVLDYIKGIGEIDDETIQNIYKKINEDLGKYGSGLKLYSETNRLSKFEQIDLRYLLRAEESQSGKKKSRLSEEFISNPKLKVVICGAKGVAEGLDFTDASRMYIVEENFSIGVMNQVEARINRKTSKYPFEIVYLVADFDVDNRVSRSLVAKDIMADAITTMGKKLSASLIQMERIGDRYSYFNNRYNDLLSKYYDTSVDRAKRIRHSGYEVNVEEVGGEKQMIVKELESSIGLKYKVKKHFVKLAEHIHERTLKEIEKITQRVDQLTKQNYKAPDVIYLSDLLETQQSIQDRLVELTPEELEKIKKENAPEAVVITDISKENVSQTSDVKEEEVKSDSGSKSPESTAEDKENWSLDDLAL